MRHKLPHLPGWDPAFSSLNDARMYWPIQRTRLQLMVREGFQAAIGIPLERTILFLWKRGMYGRSAVKHLGLPRGEVERTLQDKLIIHVNPRELIRSVHWNELPKRRRPSSSTFIWDGDWDLQRGDLRYGSRYRFVSDLVHHRHDLIRSEAFQRFKRLVDENRPWSSHQQGLLLDSEERILAYLRVYLAFMDDMAEHGFDMDRGKDDLGVAVSREGKLIKINRGLHRLAMAQYLGLQTVPVKVKAVHRVWWEAVTRNTQGAEALEHMAQALQHCRPEQQPGPLDPHETPEHFSWPPKQV
ncbi:MAG: ParB-like nuclease domain [Halomonas sp. HL-48]|nr:hypothetical protein [Halomonas sp. HL-48]KPQ25797.1 MAG: ParB-like nuclease domain [Halomonas sp. HL-48]